MTISWTKFARDAFFKAQDYVFAEFGRRAVLKFIDEVDEVERLLSDMPSLGAVEPLLSNRLHLYRSLVIGKHNKLIYFIDGETIVIAALWDTRREPTSQATETIK